MNGIDDFFVTYRIIISSDFMHLIDLNIYLVLSNKSSVVKEDNKSIVVKLVIFFYAKKVVDAIDDNYPNRGIFIRKGIKVDIFRNEVLNFRKDSDIFIRVGDNFYFNSFDIFDVIKDVEMSVNFIGTRIQKNLNLLTFF